jgi:hypothetical protein
MQVGDPVNSLDFDFSGQYLAVGGKGVKVRTHTYMNIHAYINTYIHTPGVLSCVG